MTTGKTRWAAIAAAAVLLVAGRASAQSVYLSGTQLVVYGRDMDDWIEVLEDPKMGTVTVRMSNVNWTIPWITWTFPRAQVSRLYINPLGGDDYAFNKTTLPSSMEGWSGNDYLWGGSGDDDLWGDSSYYKWITGNDWIYGNAGNDTIHGGPGDDYITGNDGDDTIWTDGGTMEQAYGGAGTNILITTFGVNVAGFVNDYSGGYATIYACWHNYFGNFTTVADAMACRGTRFGDGY